MRALCILTILAAVTGCSPYVNVPGQPGSVATKSANDMGVRDAVADAMRMQLRLAPPARDWAITLPKGSSDETYQWVLERIGRGARYTGQTDVDVYDVVSIQIRGLNGQVDLVLPLNQTGDIARVRSIYLERKLNGWDATYGKTWQISVPEAMELANPSAAPRYADYVPVDRR